MPPDDYEGYVDTAAKAAESSAGSSDSSNSVPKQADGIGRRSPNKNEPRRKPPGEAHGECVHTYFIHCPATNRVKIGRAKNPQARLKDLSTAASSPLVLLGFIRGDHEGELHARHEVSRANREWFAATESVVAEVLEQTGAVIEVDRPKPAERTRLEQSLLTLRRIFDGGGAWISPGPYDDADYTLEPVDQSFGAAYWEMAAANIGDLRECEDDEELEELMDEYEEVSGRYDNFRENDAIAVLCNVAEIAAVWAYNGDVRTLAPIASVLANAYWSVDGAGAELLAFAINRQTGEILEFDTLRLGLDGVTDLEFLKPYDAAQAMASKVLRQHAKAGPAC